MATPPERSYEYVGPTELLDLGDVPYRALRSLDDLRDWIAVESYGPFTFVVDLSGILRVAARGVEHVQVAQREPVLAAGEVIFEDEDKLFARFTNQSTGYCPDPSCIEAVCRSAGRIGLAVGDVFERAFVFRRCENCSATNVVKEQWFVCGECETELPEAWNFGD